MAGMRRLRLSVALIALGSIAQTAGAQSPPPSVWAHGTTLTGSAGAGLGSRREGAAVGGALGWELTAKVAIEGSGLWLDRGDGADAFAAALKVRAALFGHDRATPFVTAGIGAYRASYARMSAEIPAFHRRRMEGRTGPGERATFTDLGLVVGGGISVFVTRHIALRPDLESMVVIRDSHRYVVTTVALQVAYHFEDHPVTPGRKR